MKSLVAAILLFAMTASADTGLEFPSNDLNAPECETPLEMFAFKFTGAANLPYYGTADGGVTISWEIYPNAPAGTYAYWVTFFMDENSGSFGSNAYYGAHPYPWTYDGACPGNYGGTQTENPVWEISNGVDQIGRDDIFDSAGTCTGEDPENNLVTYDVWHKQAFTVKRTGTSVEMKFYVDLPSVADPDVIVLTRTENTGNAPIPTTPDLYWGDAPWACNDAQHERLNGILRNVKIWDGLKDEQYLIDNAGADIQLDKSDTTNEPGLWYHNPNPTPSDILDKSGGTAHDPVWVDVNFKPTLYDTGTPAAVPTFLGTLITGGSIQ